jgi:hypothetical protein
VACPDIVEELEVMVLLVIQDLVVNLGKVILANLVTQGIVVKMG